MRNSLITLHSGPCCFRAALAKSLCLNVALLGCSVRNAHGLRKTTHSLAASAEQEVQVPRCLRGSWLCFQYFNINIAPPNHIHSFSQWSHRLTMCQDHTELKQLAKASKSPLSGGVSESQMPYELFLSGSR